MLGFALGVLGGAARGTVAVGVVLFTVGNVCGWPVFGMLPGVVVPNTPQGAGVLGVTVLPVVTDAELPTGVV